MPKNVLSHSGGSYDASSQLDIIYSDPFQGPIQVLSGIADVINIDNPLGNNYICSGNASADLMTMSRAIIAGVDDGLVVNIWSNSAFAHKITVTGLLQSGTASTTSAALAAFAGAGVSLRAYNGKWQIVGSTAALTLA